VIVEDDHSARSNDLTEKVQTDEDLMKPVTAVDEGRVGGKAFRKQPRQRQRRWLLNQPNDRVESGGAQQLPAGTGPGSVLNGSMTTCCGRGAPTDTSASPIASADAP